MQPRTSRRELVRAGIGLAAAGTLAARVGAAEAQPTAGGGEAAALAYALQIERLSVIAYRQVLATSVLASGVPAQLQPMLAQDEQHVIRIEQALMRLGATLPQGPTGTDDSQTLLGQHGVHRSLTVLPTQHECLRVLIDVESLAEGAYFKGIPQLQDPALIRLGVETMGSNAQHWAILSGIQHPDALMTSVPYPFVQGAP